MESISKIKLNLDDDATSDCNAFKSAKQEIEQTASSIKTLMDSSALQCKSLQQPIFQSTQLFEKQLQPLSNSMQQLQKLCRPIGCTQLFLNQPQLLSNSMQQLQKLYQQVESIQQFQKQQQGDLKALMDKATLCNFSEIINAAIKRSDNMRREYNIQDYLPYNFYASRRDSEMEELKNEIYELKKELQAKNQQNTEIDSDKHSSQENIELPYSEQVKYESKINALENKVNELTSELYAKNKLIEELKLSNHSPQENLVLAHSERFRQDYDKLIELGYMCKADGGYLIWLKSKQSLAEYFGYQKKRAKWKDIENLFQTKRLSHLLSVTDNVSKDYLELKTLLQL